MEKPDKRIKAVWVAEAFTYMLAIVITTLMLLFYLSYTLKANLFPEIQNPFFMPIAAFLILSFFTVLFSVLATVRYRHHGYVLGPSDVSIRDASLFSQNHVLSYKRIGNAYVANSGISGMLHTLLGISVVKVVTNDRESLTFQIVGVSEPNSLIRGLMDRVNPGFNAERADTVSKMGILNEINAVQSMEARDGLSSQQKNTTNASQQANTIQSENTLRPQNIQNAFTGRLNQPKPQEQPLDPKSTIYTIVESKLSDCDVVPDETYCDVMATANIELPNQISKTEDEMLNLTRSPNVKKTKKTDRKKGKQGIKGIFAKRKDKKSIEDIIDQ
ncbi:MAG: hypothetical protein ABIG39_02710 [Candidatus Micrarchaeota archaeon]